MNPSHQRRLTPKEACRPRLLGSVLAAAMLAVLIGASGPGLPGFFYDRNYEAPTSKEGREAEKARMQAQLAKNLRERAEEDARDPGQVSMSQSSGILAGFILGGFLFLTFAGVAINQ
mmetsp:Transcript_23413/g.42270  ORF Transcript_23413/g.42270 Transcript_23413/m.42270 type:complete len:117 (+) Transcript_23413:93-443(+)|eukprot:CAMPEP_0197654822 /NCGR_PEP_ID=MMETSP1338-20131121/39080_1 /TAXON_ID=43686 ORGANISM="Pelagodinium beii, Strain RCC1491" /NCGR_SAMPLE_ID=MMETSP1338 /ASSEMBLY_ACC=CAM_ASM_000754 /LENGTH=116 /DNA_ID=CAMNT_0043230339 /DNA_START=53 /DNA_END=403 /DNA_ORIENTATION=+